MNSEQSEDKTIQMTDDGLVMPDELVGFTGTLVVGWPNEKLQTMRCRIEEPGIPEVCGYICRGVMPSEGRANGVPGGSLRINGTVYEIEDARNYAEVEA